MAIQKDGKAPYAPTQTVLGFVSRCRNQGLRGPFDISDLVRAGVSESVAPRTLTSLKLLGLIEEDGRISDAFAGVLRAPEAEFKQGFGKILTAAYADALSFAHPATQTIGDIEDAFRNYNPQGQRAGMVALFLGLLEYAGIDVASAKGGRISAQASGANNTPKQIGRGPGRKARLHAPAPIHPPVNAVGVGLPDTLSALLKDLPPKGEGWTQGQYDKFISAFGFMLKYCYPIIAHMEPGGAGSTVEREEELAGDANS